MLPTVLPEWISGPTSTERFVEDWLINKYGGYLEIPFPSPLLDPQTCQWMINDFHRACGSRFTWGDYGANRKLMWRGFYGHSQEKYIHLGIDINLQGIPVSVDKEAHVVLVDNDYPEPQGWGTRVVVFVPEQNIYLIYAHLAPKVRCRKDDILKPGTVIGRVGTWPCNGDWYRHLHVQAVRAEAWKYFYPHRLPELDGYCSPHEWDTMRVLCPDASHFVQIP